MHKDSRRSGDKEHDRSGAGEEGYVQDVRAMSGVVRDLLYNTMLYCVKSGWWEHGLRGERWWLGLEGLEAGN